MQSGQANSSWKLYEMLELESYYLVKMEEVL